MNLEGALHTINPRIVQPTEGGFDGDTQQEVGYTASKQRHSSDPDDPENVYNVEPPTVDPNSPECYAKKILIEGQKGERHKYFVKIGVSGYMYNPWGLYSEGTQNRQAIHMGKPAWTFREVSEQSFYNYCMFLKTRNQSWLNNAEREIRNA